MSQDTYIKSHAIALGFCLKTDIPILDLSIKALNIDFGEKISEVKVRRKIWLAKAQEQIFKVKAELESEGRGAVF